MSKIYLFGYLIFVIDLAFGIGHLAFKNFISVSYL